MIGRRTWLWCAYDECAIVAHTNAREKVRREQRASRHRKSCIGRSQRRIGAPQIPHVRGIRARLQEHHV